MRYHVLATDYDGTLATHGTVDQETLEALGRLRRSGRKLVLVTGRQLDDLAAVFPHLDLFERIVAENGALLYRPADREENLLTEPAPEKLAARLREKGVDPVAVGKGIVATWEPHQAAVLEAIHELGLELQVIFNKGAVMVLPSGVNKAWGLTAALAEMGMSPHNAVGVGDAENDHALLSMCECGVAVGNALPQVKERADLVTEHTHGAGVAELIDRIIASDLKEVDSRLDRHYVPIGTTRQGKQLMQKPFGETLLIAGTSGSGKSVLATGIIERLIACGYQVCVIDPEGDYQLLRDAIVVGDAKRPPECHEVIELFRKADRNAVVNLMGMSLDDRPGFFQALFPQLQQLRAQTGRPHWILIDECHHLAPANWEPLPVNLPEDGGLLLLTVHPETVSRKLIASVDKMAALGEDPARTVRTVWESLDSDGLELLPTYIEPGEALFWSRRNGEPPVAFRGVTPTGEIRRHRHKYAEGQLGEDRSFYFKGPDGKLNLRVQNLALFIQIGKGIDDDTWTYHLRRGDYSCWFREAIKDAGLAEEAASVEQREDLTAEESRSLIEAAIRKRYTAPA